MSDSRACESRPFPASEIDRRLSVVVTRTGVRSGFRSGYGRIQGGMTVGMQGMQTREASLDTPADERLIGLWERFVFINHGLHFETALPCLLSRQKDRARYAHTYGSSNFQFTHRLTAVEGIEGGAGLLS